MRKIIYNIARKFAGFFLKLFKKVPDEKYLSFYYFIRTGKKLNLKNPVGFNEKLNWLKIYDRKPIYTTLADKYLVRKYVADKIGEEYLIPLIGHWNKFEDINFDELPNQFVLKCNHDSGSVKIIKDKNKLTKKDIKKLKKHFDKKLKNNSFYFSREFVYRDINPCIIAEKYLGKTGLKDYKFFCFNGEPKLMFVVSNRFTSEKHEDYFDMNGNPVDVYNGVSHSKTVPALPDCFDKMKEIVKKLSQNIPTVRMDLYEYDGKIYFGEYTFYSAGGTLLFQPKEWERKLGDWIDLNNDKKESLS